MSKPIELVLKLVLTGVLLAMGAFPKLTGAPESVYMFGVTMAQSGGIALAEPFGRYAIGLFELATAIVLWLPQFKRFGTFMSSALFAGAVATHVLIIGISTNFPAAGEVPPFSGATASEGDGGVLFGIAVVSLLISLVLLLRPAGSSGR